MFLVNWHGYDDSHNSWERREAFRDSIALDIYWKKKDDIKYQEEAAEVAAEMLILQQSISEYVVEREKSPPRERMESPPRKTMASPEKRSVREKTVSFLTQITERVETMCDEECIELFEGMQSILNPEIEHHTNHKRERDDGNGNGDAEKEVMQQFCCRGEGCDRLFPR